MPATQWWAIALVLLLGGATPPILADPTETPPETVVASDSLLPGPVLDTSLLKSHRKDDAWRKQTHYVEDAHGPRINDQLLEPILEGLALPEPRTELSFWEALENWLNEYLGDRPEPVLPDWLRSVRLPEDTMLWLFYISCALIVLLAIGIVANELRHAGSRRKGAVDPVAGVLPAVDAGAEERRPDSVLEVPAWLLDRLVARLGLSLSGARGDSLTHRELLLAGGHLPGDIVAPLTSLAGAAERIRYDKAAPEPSEVTVAVQKGTVLLASLEDRPESAITDHRQIGKDRQ